MIRPVTSITLILAAASGLYLYQVKHRTHMLDRQIAATLNETAALRARIGILQAEWALLNQPDRLGDLAEHYLALKPLQPVQFVAASDLATHLPPIAPPEASPSESSPPDDLPKTNTGAIAAIAMFPALPGAMAENAAAALTSAASPLPALGVLKAVAVMTPAMARPPARQTAAIPRRPPPAPALANEPIALAFAHPRPEPMAHGPRGDAANPRLPVFHAPVATLVSTPHFIGRTFTGSALGGRHVSLPPPVPLAPAGSEGP